MGLGLCEGGVDSCRRYLLFYWFWLGVFLEEFALALPLVTVVVAIRIGKRRTFTVYNGVIGAYFTREINRLYELVYCLLLSRKLSLQECDLAAHLSVFLLEEIDHGRSLA